MWLSVINKVKVTHQGEGHIKVKEKYLHPFKFYVAHALFKRVVCIRQKCYLFLKCSWIFKPMWFLQFRLLGLPRGGSPTAEGSADLLCGIIFAENCTKIKKNCTGGAFLASPRSAIVRIYHYISICLRFHFFRFAGVRRKMSWLVLPLRRAQGRTHVSVRERIQPAGCLHLVSDIIIHHLYRGPGRPVRRLLRHQGVWDL